MVMSDNAADLHMLNVVVSDMEASLDFYRRLGVAVPAGENAADVHVQLRMPGGFSLELDTAESARLWHAGWRAEPASARVVIGFSLPTREAGEAHCSVKHRLWASGRPGRSRDHNASYTPGMPARGTRASASVVWPALSNCHCRGLGRATRPVR